jgi:hypothetical protein
MTRFLVLVAVPVRGRVNFAWGVRMTMGVDEIGAEK